VALNVREDLFREKIDGKLTPELLGEIASRALNRRAGVLGAQVLTGGCLNRVIAIRLEPPGEDLVLKISPDVADRSIEREGKVLDCFRRLTRLAVPQPHLVDVSGQLLPGSFLVMSRLPGRVMHEATGRLNAEQRGRILERITRDVVELHEHTAQGFGGVELPETQRVEWPAFWVPRFQRVLERVRASGLVPTRFLAEVEHASELFPRLLDIGRRSTLTHYDIWSGNVMVAMEGSEPRVSGYLDIPGFFADPVRELSFMEMFGMADARFYASYRAAHPLDAGWELRKNIYNLKMHLTHVTMYPEERYYRDGAAACLRFIQERSGR
jgi:fructosamine-3-kinase